MIKAVLFDMDGVLIDSHNAWFERFNASRKHFGLSDISLDAFDRDVWARNFVETVSTYFPGKHVDEVRDFYFDTYSNFSKMITKMKGVDEALQYIKGKKKKLAVISNTQTQLVKKILDEIGILPYFDIIIGGERVKNAKPNPEIVLLGCKELGIECPESLFIGDTIFDKMAALKAGCKFIGFRFDNGINDLIDIKERI